MNLPTKSPSGRLTIAKATAKLFQVDKGQPKWNISGKKQPTTMMVFATSNFVENTVSPRFQIVSRVKWRRKSFSLVRRGKVKVRD